MADGLLHTALDRLEPTAQANDELEQTPSDAAEKVAKKNKRGELLADVYSMPTVNAAEIINKAHPLEPGEGVNFSRLIGNLRDQVSKINNNDMTRPEAMLISQAHTLDSLFSMLAQRSMDNMSEHLGAAERYMRLALKSQSQCATTLKILGEMKNPKQIAFVKQANIAQGHQQVNNGQESASRTEETKKQPNELLEQQHGERLDIGAQRAPEASNTTVEAMVTVNRSENT